jgi:hypothetical protein
MNKVINQYDMVPVKKDGSNQNDPIKHSSIQKNKAQAYKILIENFMANESNGKISD